MFDPADEPGPFTNFATADAVGETGDTVSDSDGATFEPLPPIEGPAISLLKSAGEVTRVDGTLFQSVPITLTVTNSGDEVLNELQIDDPLDIFGSGQAIEILDVVSSLSINDGFIQLTDSQLLSGNDTLAIGESATISFTLVFDPADEPGPFTNFATADAVGETGDTVSDSDGATFEPLPPIEGPAISLLKSAGEVTRVDGTLFQSVPITLTVTNTGDELLNELQIDDPLDIFGSGQAIEILDVVSSLSINDGFIQLTDSQLLNGNDTLAVGASATIAFTLVFDPADEPGPFNNIATATAVGESGNNAVTDSDNAEFGRLPQLMPVIELTKTAGEVTRVADTAYQAVPMTITVSNLGDEALTNLQINDPLDIFETGQAIEVRDVDSSLAINDGFIQLTDSQMLVGNDSLAIGESATIGFTLVFDSQEEPGPFTNIATATAVGETSNIVVTDDDSAEFEPVAIDIFQCLDIDVRKTAGKSMVRHGELVPYDVAVTNRTALPIANVTILDEIPAGFQFGSESAILIRTGPDSTLGTGDDVVEPIGSTQSSGIEFDAFNLSESEGVVIRYFSKVTTGVAPGIYTSSASLFDIQETCTGSPATVEVISSDPIFEKTTIIGKVFHDRNENYVQDEDERGIPGVRLATVSGLTMETDSYGRYHLADVDVDRFERGGNFIIKLDKATLPDEANVISENPRVIRLTQALMSKINFAVAMPERPMGDCVQSCVDFRRVVRRTALRPILFDTGKYEIPDGLVDNLKRLLDENKDKHGLRLLFIGHADSNPIYGRLAVTLGAGGEAGNKILSLRRAQRVCEYVRDVVGTETDCDNIEGKGSSQPVKDNSSDYEKSRNRRVEILLEYYDASSLISHTPLPPQVCVDKNAQPFPLNWPVEVGDVEFVGNGHHECLVHTGPLSAISMKSAEARNIRISGGRFGSDILVAETLPGRPADGNPITESEVTIYASVGYDDDVDCARHPDVIVPGCYPIQLTTAAGSELRITRAGDVLRHSDPSNYEHIVATPFRDETDQTLISGLRVMNDGIEPASGFPSYFGRSKAWYSQFWSTGDPLVADPRLDVLALDRAVVDENGKLADPVRFSVYTNYPDYIDRYRLEFYGIDASGYWQKLPHNIVFDNVRFDTPRELPKGIDLSRYVELGYILKASDCEGSFANQSNDSFDESKCHVDVTGMRLLTLRREKTGQQQAVPGELWGKNNLDRQSIPVEGGRIRVHGFTESDFDDIEVGGDFDVDGEVIPFGKNKRFVLEDHGTPGTYTYAIGGVLDGIETITGQQITADATEIEVEGGLFGCNNVFIEKLPGRKERHDPIIPAVTVVADQSLRRAPDSLCPDEIVVRSSEDTILRITDSGDVRPVRYPVRGENFQQLVVAPYRDYTDSTVVSAVRIANEGFEAGVDGDDIVIDDDETIGTLEEPYNFVVALANLTVGENDVTGNAGPLAADPHFDGSTFVDGRLAFYAKRKTEGYLLTAQMDSSEDELRNFSDNLKRKDPRRIFRQLDPNRYYPIYGDDSTTTTDVDTQGALYLRLDWDKNTALWGNFNTGMTDTEFMQYNRSLYGANLAHENQTTTKFGDAKTTLKLFGSEAQSVPAHVTFKATGGSLYYLRDTDIVQGSEKAWIEVRRKDTEQVMEREVLIEGRDYEIDAIQGRIILRRPLSQVVNDRGPSIIRSTPLDGDDVYLLVDYEYVPDSFEANDLTYGGRGRAWLNDHVAIGATKVTDQRAGTDYDMGGVDLMIKGGEGTYLSAEFGRSDARQSNANFMSFDGGLSFRSQTSGGSGDSLSGDATAVEGRIDLADFSDNLKGDIRAWSKHRDAEFSTGRLGQGTGISENGVEAQAKIGEKVEIFASYTDFEREQLSRERVAKIQAEGKFGDLQAGMELRHEDVDILGPSAIPSGLSAAANDGEALLVGARLGYDLSESTTVYAAAQTVADDKGAYRENDLVSVGVNTELSERTAVSVELSDGDRGSAITAGLDLSTFEGLDFNLSGGVGSGATSQFASRYSIAEGHELYGSYTVNPDRTEGARNLLTLGQRRAFGNRLSIFTESQFGKDKAYANVGHVFGLDLDGNDDWRFSASAQFSEIDEASLAFERQALSLGAYHEQDDLKLSSRIEYREDEGNGIHNRQYLTSNSFTKILDDDRRWIGQLNLSWTKDELNGGRDARFVELDIGQAYRPFNNDRLNILGKYSFLYDLPTEGQVPVRFDEKSHLLSVEGIYDLNDRWELGGKIAYKKGEERLQREAGQWHEFGLRLATVRARYHLTHKWDALAEYRWLSDIDGDNDRDGALLGLYRHVGDNFKVGAGYNFTDFDDRLRIDSYKNHGWFVDFIGKY